MKNKNLCDRSWIGSRYPDRADEIWAGPIEDQPQAVQP
jgi:hypothetical protein